MVSYSIGRRVNLCLTVLAFISSAGCQQKTALRPTPGVFAGTVVDAAGNPVSGAQISIIGTTSRGETSSRDVYTDDHGIYRAKMPDGAYGAKWASAHIHYNDRDALFALDAPNPRLLADQDISSGPIVPFVFKISGITSAHRDPNSWDSYYGQAITLYGDSNCPDKKTVQLTLNPVGPLADGSPGKTLVMSETQWAPFKDIPLGIYAASVQITDGNGRVVPSRIGHWQGDWAPSVTAAWDLNGVAGPNGHTGAMLNLRYTCSAQ